VYGNVIAAGKIQPLQFAACAWFERQYA